MNDPLTWKWVTKNIELGTDTCFLKHNRPSFKNHSSDVVEQQRQAQNGLFVLAIGWFSIRWASCDVRLRHEVITIHPDLLQSSHAITPLIPMVASTVTLAIRRWARLRKICFSGQMIKVQHTKTILKGWFPSPLTGHIMFIFRSKEVATQMWAPKFLRGPRGNLRQLRSRVGNEQHSSIWRAYRFSPWFKPCITQRNYRTRFGYSGWYWTQHPSSLDLQLGMVSSRSRSLWPPNSTKTFINKDIDIKWQR